MSLETFVNKGEEFDFSVWAKDSIWQHWYNMRGGTKHNIGYDGGVLSHIFTQSNDMTIAITNIFSQENIGCHLTKVYMTLAKQLYWQPVGVLITKMCVTFYHIEVICFVKQSIDHVDLY